MGDARHFRSAGGPPPSVASYLFILMYQKEHAPDVTSFVFVATLMTILVLPLVLAFWA